MQLRLHSTNSYIRPLCLSDVNQDYLSWFSDPYVLEYISFASTCPTIDSLKEYVRSKLASSDCVFLGIYDSMTNRIVGTIKFDPIDRQSGTSEIGILIGNPDFRGKGIASEALNACINYAKSSINLSYLTLGVRESNAPAIRLYKKLGFVVSSKGFSSLRMKLAL